MSEVNDDGVQNSGGLGIDLNEDSSQTLNQSKTFPKISGEGGREEENEGSQDRFPAAARFSADNGVFDDRPEGEDAIVDCEEHVVVDVAANVLPGQAVFAPIDHQSKQKKSIISLLRVWCWVVSSTCHIIKC